MRTAEHADLQDRLTHLEKHLGFSVHDPQGRSRLELALTQRRPRRSAR